MISEVRGIFTETLGAWRRSHGETQRSMARHLIRALNTYPDLHEEISSEDFWSVVETIAPEAAWVLS